MSTGISHLRQKLESKGFKPDVIEPGFLRCKFGGVVISYRTDVTQPGHCIVYAELFLPKSQASLAPIVANRVMNKTVFPRLRLVGIPEPAEGADPLPCLLIEVSSHYDSVTEFAEHSTAPTNDVIKAWDMFIDYMKEMPGGLG